MNKRILRYTHNLELEQQDFGTKDQVQVLALPIYVKEPGQCR